MAKDTENKEITNDVQKKEPRFKREKCKVLAFNKKTKELDVNFKGYGIRLKNVNDVKSDFVIVKYVSDIGKADFKCKL